MNDNFDCNKIKLVIWDLDDTFWEGTLSEGEVRDIPEHVALVEALTDRGIVNSVCSKNDRAAALQALEDMQTARFMVYVSINWEPKGARIAALIRDMQLRAENVLFLDDNPANLNEALYYNPGLMTAAPEEIGRLEEYVRQTPVTDAGHKRLQSYRILEEKHEARKHSASNDAFLWDSNIKVTIERGCLKESERIAELIGRTNQLNYTKKRITRDELNVLLRESAVECGYVTVRDKYGEYGVVGFYAKRDGMLEHFLFSCRILGMGVEQYVYAQLGWPAVSVVGETAVELKPDVRPKWINQEKELHTQGRRSFRKDGHAPRILFKGPCDLSAIFSFIEEDETVDCEFTYVNQETGVTIEQISHTDHIVQSLTLTAEQKKRVIEELPFSDRNMYSDKLFIGEYDVVCISSLVDSNLGVYRRIGTGEKVAYGEGYYPLTDSRNWTAYETGTVYTAGCQFSRGFLEEFSCKYEFLGINTPEKIAENIRFIREHLPQKTLLIVLLGAELAYEKNRLASYEGRHLVQRDVNSALRRQAEACDNLVCLDINRYLTGQECFYDQFNHFVPAVYYAMSGELIRIVGEWTGHRMFKKSKLYMHTESVKDALRKIRRRIGRK